MPSLVADGKLSIRIYSRIRRQFSAEFWQ